MKKTMVVYGNETSAEELEAQLADQCPVTLILVSSTRVYGASPGHNLCLDEDTPLEEEAVSEDRANLIALENVAQAFAESCRLVILRPVHVLGGPHEGVIGQAMRNAQLRTAFGFDPLIQVIHHKDVEQAVKLAARHDISGAFNLCGPGALPLSELARIAGTERVAGIGGMISDRLERARLRHPAHLPEDETRYPIHVDDQRFRGATGYAPKRTLPETVAALEDGASQ